MSDMVETEGNSTTELMSLADFIANERQRLTERRNAIQDQQRALQAELDSINREFVAVEAYESAKTGKRAIGKTTSTTPSPRKGSRRADVSALIDYTPQGLTRGEILERLGLKGDKSGEMSVSNALTAMVKGNQLRREGGKYLPVQAAQNDAPETERVSEAA